MDVCLNILHSCLIKLHCCLNKLDDCLNILHSCLILLDDCLNILHSCLILLDNYLIKQPNSLKYKSRFVGIFCFTKALPISFKLASIRIMVDRRKRLPRQGLNSNILTLAFDIENARLLFKFIKRPVVCVPSLWFHYPVIPER